MERMVIKHLSGSKANQVEEFALKHHQELSFGREPSSTILYDADRDDLVGRQHAKIVQDPQDSESFLLTDLESRNGTFVNHNKISGTVKLNPGDVVQFGPDGPKFQFDVEPRPKSATKPTRVVETGKPKAPETRVVVPGNEGTESLITKPQSKTTVGKATVERMISHSVEETKKQEGRKYAAVGGIAAVVILILLGAVIGGAYWYSSNREKALQDEIATKAQEVESKAADIEKKLEEEKANAPVAASEISDKFSNSVVLIEVAWRLIHPQSKTQVYHLHLPSQMVAQIAGKLKADFRTNSMSTPVYRKTQNGYEPILVEEKGQLNVPIGSVHSGTGFIVTSDGFILTNRHVAATWKTSYQWPENMGPGVVISEDGQQILSFSAPPPKWVPANHKATGGMLGAFNIRIKSSADYVGVNDKLEVALPGKDRRMNSQLVEASDRHDVALLKIDKPTELTKVELYDNYDEVKKGEQVVIMGYPGVTAAQYGVVKSEDTMFNETTQLKTIPNPTVTVTSVSNILRSNTKDEENIIISEIGDVIQLSTGSTGPGNSGGPVFDMKGRVIGIYFAYLRGADLQYVVPIRYGKQLME